MFVDTDLPTPEIANRVRIDLYRADGTWFASRDVQTAERAAFPLSFDLQAADGAASAVRVRLRVYPSTYIRDYQGERFADWPDVLNEPPSGDGQPRLQDGGSDATPAVEPLPAVTVDRLIEVTTPAEGEQQIAVVLHGACAGIMADLRTGESCAISREQGRVPLAQPTDPVSAASHTDDLREPCDGVDPDAGKLCVPGGVFVLGERAGSDYRSEAFVPSDHERLVRVHRFALDLDEVSVARYRAAADTLQETVRYLPRSNPGALGDDPSNPASCTYSSEPNGRETHPLNCCPSGTFRQLCQLDGGDLPSEVQWEYAAVLAGGAGERLYPWGDTAPTCEQAVFARAQLSEPLQCTTSPALVAIDAAAGQADRTPLGLRGMGGSLSEFVLEAPLEYTSEEWTQLGFEQPSPQNPRGANDTFGSGDWFLARGGSWAVPGAGMRSSFRHRVPGTGPFTGARCAYPLP